MPASFLFGAIISLAEPPGKTSTETGVGAALEGVKQTQPCSNCLWQIRSLKGTSRHRNRRITAQTSSVWEQRHTLLTDISSSEKMSPAYYGAFAGDICLTRRYQMTIGPKLPIMNWMLSDPLGQKS